MRPEDVPYVGQLLSFGPDDAVYDTLILIGPLIVLLFVVVGRNLLTIGVGLAYVLAFVAGVAYHTVGSAEG